ncbi:MAG TPA: YdbL family protein [Opitutaceae bacterium]|nr:YdbL family protein [Opitutaceae bacterium]
MKAFFLRLFLIVALVAPVLSLRAEDVHAVRQRMSERLPEIDKMKEKGVVGENNQGLLEARPGSGEADTAVINAENADRQVVYAAIAKKANASADQVAKARARHIAAGSRAGVWIQDEAGNWKKKD